MLTYADLCWQEEEEEVLVVEWQGEEHELKVGSEVQLLCCCFTTVLLLFLLLTSKGRSTRIQRKV
jgi:hypothetical protein